MTSKQQRQDFIDHVRESAKSLFVPRPLVNEPGSVLPIHQVWLHNLYAGLIGEPEYGYQSPKMAFGHGPSSWAALASNVEVYNDEDALPEGVAKGQGYTDGETLFVPLSTLKEKVLSEDSRTSLSWLNEGILFHARHLLGETCAPNENWAKAGGNVNPQSKAAMQYALAQSSPSAGDWFEMHQSSKAHNMDALVNESGSGILHLIRAVQSASDQVFASGIESGPWRGSKISQNEESGKSRGILGNLNSASRDNYRSAGNWLMQQCEAFGVSWAEFPLAVKIAKAGFLTRKSAALAYFLADFVNGVQDHAAASPALVAVANTVVKHSGFVSPLYPLDTLARARYMRAQAQLLNPEVSANDLAEAILNIQEMAPPRVPEPGMMNYAQIMSSLIGLTKGSGMSEELLIKCAEHAPSVAVRWARKNLSKVVDGKNMFVRRLADGLVANKMEDSGDARVAIVQAYLDLGNGTVYKNARHKKVVPPEYGFHHILKSGESWAAEAMANVLKVSVSEAPNVLLYVSTFEDEKPRAAALHDLPSILLDAGMTPSTKVLFNKSHGEIEIRTLANSGVLDGAYANYQAKQLGKNTPVPRASSSSIRL